MPVSSHVVVAQGLVQVSHGLEERGCEEHDGAIHFGEEQDHERGQQLHFDLWGVDGEGDGAAHEADDGEQLEGLGVEHELVLGVHARENGEEEMHEHELHADASVGVVLSAVVDLADDAGGRAPEHHGLHEKLRGLRTVPHAEDERRQGCGHQEEQREAEGRLYGSESEGLVPTLEERNQDAAELDDPGHAFDVVH